MIFCVLFFKVSFPVKINRQEKNVYETVEVRSNQKSEVIRSRHRHITLMLLAVAVVFLVLTLPNSVYFVLDLNYSFNEQPTDNDYHSWLRFRRLNILTVIMFQLSDVQHASNFFLYLSTSAKFRRTVLRIVSNSFSFLRSLIFCSTKKRNPFSDSDPNRRSSRRPFQGRMTSFRSTNSEEPTTNQRFTSTSVQQKQNKISQEFKIEN